MASSFLRFLDHTKRRNTVGRTPLDEWSARRRDLYLTTHNTHNRRTSMPPVGFEPTIPARERPQTARPLGMANEGCVKENFTLRTWIFKCSRCYESRLVVTTSFEVSSIVIFKVKHCSWTFWLKTPRSFETSVIIYQLAQRYIPENINLQPTPTWEFQIPKISNITRASHNVQAILEHNVTKMSLN